MKKTMEQKIKENSAKANALQKLKKQRYFKKQTYLKKMEMKELIEAQNRKPWTPSKQVKRTPQSKNVND